MGATRRPQPGRLPRPARHRPRTLTPSRPCRAPGTIVLRRFALRASLRSPTVPGEHHSKIPTHPRRRAIPHTTNEALPPVRRPAR
jgi:hypothetical protein